MPDDLLRGVDVPRPLPEHLRSALEARLLGPDDALVGLLRTAETPRALPSDVRDSLQRNLVRRRIVPVWLVGAAAAAVLIAGVAVVIPRTTDERTTQAAPTAPSARPTATAASPVPGTVGSGSAGSAAGVAAPLPPPPSPRPSPRTPAAAAPGSGTTSGGGSTGSGDGAPAAAPAAPQRGVSDVSPDEGPAAGGTRITLTGKDLSKAVRVEFASRPGTDLVVVSDTRITVVTPPAREPGQRADISVHLSTDEVYLVDTAFTYVEVPEVTSVDPAEGPSGGGNVVSVSGRDFRPRTTVTFGDTRASEVEVVSATQLRVVVPAHLPGPVDVTVTTAGGTSNGVPYVYTPS